MEKGGENMKGKERNRKEELEIPAEVLKVAEDALFGDYDYIVPKTVNLKGYEDSLGWEELLARGEKNDLLQIIRFISLSAGEQQLEKDGWGQLVTNKTEIWKADIQRRAKAKLAEKYGVDMDVGRNDALKLLLHAYTSSTRGNVYETQENIDRLKRSLVASGRLRLADIGINEAMLKNLLKKAHKNAEKLPKF